MTETCLAINTYKRQASKEEAIRLHINRILNISKATVSNNSEIKTK
jgi:hypothetical protein